MKICIVSYIYPNSENRTLGLFVHHQAKELAKHNEVHVITSGKGPIHEVADGVNIHRVSNFNFALFFKIIGLNRKEKLDVVHSHFLGFSTLVCSAASRILGLPFVVTIHGSEVMSYGILKKFYLRLPDKIMCVSIYTAMLARKLTARHTSIVKNGVDPERLRPDRSPQEFKKKIGLSGSKILLSVADLVRRKGIDTVIKALPSIKKQFPGVRYIVIGRGPEKENLIKLSKQLNVEGSVRFAGYVSDRELSNYYNACDVFVLMSRTLQKESAVEGFGIVFIEASLLGKPVIAGKSGGTSDAVMDNSTGFLVEPDDLASLKKKIILLLKNPELGREMGVRGKNLVMGSMLWKHNAEKTLKVYSEARARI